MSYLHHIRSASKKKSENPELGEPQVNHFSKIEEVDRRRHEVLDYMLMGYNIDEIHQLFQQDGKHDNPSKALLKEDVKTILKIGYEAREDDLKDVHDEIMRIYRLVIRESYTGFKSSQGEVETITVETGSAGDTLIDKEKTVTKEQSGDPRFLSVMIDGAKEMGKLTGAQKHKEMEIQTNIQNNHATTILSPNRTKLPDDFDQWTKKPDDAEVPTAEGISAEDLE